MAQHDYSIANQSGSAFRSDLNNALSAIATQNSGTSAPSTTFAHQMWADTTNNVMKLRNAANDGWIELYQLDGEWTDIAFENGTAAAPSIYFKDSGTDTGFYSPGANQVGITTGGTSALVVDASQRVGVGTTSPATIFHAKSDQAARTVLRADNQSSSASAYAGIQLDTYGNSWGMQTGSAAANSNSLVFALDPSGTNSEKVRIDSSGRVGIGTSSPESRLHSTKASSSYTPVATFSSQAGTAKLRIDDVSNGSSTTRLFITHNFSRPGGTFTADTASLGVAAIKFDDGSIALSTDAAGDADPADRLFINSSGNVGIGTTSPSSTLDINGDCAVANTKAYQVKDSGGTTRYAMYMSGSLSPSAGNDLFIGNTLANSLVLYTNSTERARIDSSGRLLVGTTSAIAASPLLQVEQTTGAEIALGRQDTSVVADDLMGGVSFWGRDTSGVAYTEQASVKCFADGTHDPGTNPTRLVLSTTASGASSPTERMRINDGGSIGFRTATTRNVLHISHPDAASSSLFYIVGRHSSTAMYGGTDAIYVYTNGNVQNTNNSYGAISDIKLKENIVDASSQWDDLKTIQVRNYNFKEETGHETHTQIGVVAQEVELVSPGLVSETPDRDEEGNDLGTVTKSVNYSVLYMKAVKALQEAMERIETLEAKVAALESA